LCDDGPRASRSEIGRAPRDTGAVHCDAVRARLGSRLGPPETGQPKYPAGDETGDLDATPESVEVAGIVPGDYGVAVQPPAGYSAPDVMTVVVDAGQVSVVTVTLVSNEAPATPVAS
jgi:hypothetical protein